MSAEVRELAERLGMLKECEVCARGLGSDGLLYAPAANVPGTYVTMPCPAGCADGKRLPTLEEVLDALEPALKQEDGLAVWIGRLPDSTDYICTPDPWDPLDPAPSGIGPSRLEAALRLLEAVRQ